tara:strand:+ start:2303 stop:3205 length:903 start_codon:yes stop_codon:yes gene_type:complete
MPRNVYFSQGTTPEQRLYEDITIEALKIYGHDVFYIPRSIVNTDSIFNEDALSKFGEAYQIEMYVENTDGFGGDGDLLSKFGVEIRDTVNLVLSNRRWEQLVARFQDPTEARPQEGDLIYFPLVNGLFEINYVEDETPFYQLQNVPTFKLSCQQFEYNNQEIDTGIGEVDKFETSYAVRTRLNLGSGTGAYAVGEDVTQTDGNITVTGEVAVVGTGYIDVVNQISSDSTNTGFVPTAGSWGNIIGSENSPAPSYPITTIDSFNSLDDNDPYADNSDFETEGNSFIDFTKTNPFGMPNITT